MITVRVSQKESECYQKCDLNLPTAPARDSDLTEPAGENNRDRQSGRERGGDSGSGTTGGQSISQGS